MQPRQESQTFGEFRTDLVYRRLYRGTEVVRLTATPFDVLVFLLENRGALVTRNQLRARIWDGCSITDGAIEQAINKIRKALGEKAESPCFLHTIWGKGYLFALDAAAGIDSPEPEPLEANESPVLPAPTDLVSIPQQGPFAAGALPPFRDIRIPVLHAVLASVFYAALYAVALLVEAAYGFDKFGATANTLTRTIFPATFLTTLAALWLHGIFVNKGRRGGFTVSLLVLIAAAGATYAAVCAVLPPVPVTLLSFQGFTARAAYLKDVIYFLVFAACFLLLPYHFVCRVKHEMRQGRIVVARALLLNEKSPLTPSLVRPKPGLLLALLLGALIWSLLSVARIIEHLQPSRFLDLYINLLQVQRLLFFVLGFQCLAWYYLEVRKLERTLAFQN